MVTSSFLPGHGGIESYLAGLCESVAPRLAVLAPARRDGAPIPAELPYPVHGYEGFGRMLVPTRGIAGAIEAAARRHGTELVLFGTPWPLALLGPALTERGLRYATIIHGAEMLVPGAAPLVSLKLARALSGAELLFPVSGFTSDATVALLRRHGLDVPPIRRLQARIDLERFRPDAEVDPIRARFGLSRNDRVVLAFGRLVRRKGVDRLIRVLPGITARVPSALLVIAGTGPDTKRLERLARKTPGKTIFAGRVPDEDAAAVYTLADVFALPVADRYRGLEIEGLGVVLLEAAACGTPCVTGRSGGTPEAVIDGTSGFVVNAHDGVELTDRISYLLSHPEEAEAMGRAGRAHVKTYFSAAAPPLPLLEWLDDQLR